MLTLTGAILLTGNLARTVFQRSSTYATKTRCATWFSSRTPFHVQGERNTSLNYAKLCVELNYTGAVIGEWGDLVNVILYWNNLCWTGISQDSGGKAFVMHRWWRRQRIERQISWEACNLEVTVCRVRKVSTRVSIPFWKLTGCARRYLMKIVAYMGFRQRRPCIDVHVRRSTV